jgi:hypothetical protein
MSDASRPGFRLLPMRMRRQALREYLSWLRVLELEERDRRGYRFQPQCVEEYRPWEDAAAWPKD